MRLGNPITFLRLGCSENFVQSQSLRRAQDTRKQFLSMMDKYKLDVVSARKNFKKLRKAMTAGLFFLQLERPAGGLRDLSPQPAIMHPPKQWSFSETTRLGDLP
uniref:Uncharacterized protein n=1 Tax=Rhizophora mucronata TaxID=61149 RepID=A0A2P2PL27_RHIMU